MATIHPKPQLLFMRDDGDGGMSVVVKTSAGSLEVMPLTPDVAARWLSQISEFMERKFRQQMGLESVRHG